MSENVAVITDLIFRSRIELAARAAGAAVATVTSARGLAPRLAEGNVRLVIVDLDLPEDDVTAAIDAARAAGVERIVAYYPHVQKDLAERAKTAGATLVLPRSAFVAQLPELLAGDP
ncbi:MAG TPA: hypothetical protein P5572_08330 [Phycisphaerae bacterium]|nr:hypothetical protein [Phycisphaerales bacterium]HRX85010.1 hypothetical protein [Phycisphaerae bacterium]